ncbi:MAG TPA: NAD(P)-dependent oxidoreductase [Candidatus Krumholzibacteria bacterium]|nr:NAD(P)-dependent oxidoreductase [Candidatus Krumholzibacteria bacterium]HPD72658.1 NAD(P)-dependent oxidoreductase [Candidatus Krumholzibacteria bacterium]HRY40410.1 NAD(P)-dependent oxidoreductase [Candidatus Krumholzibacteria bacterium]
MDTSLPGIVVTGASGFVGRHFVTSAAGRYRLFCVARRLPREVGIPAHENMQWFQADIARWETLREVVTSIKNQGGASFVLHLAGYYDFRYMEHPEYERTNVLGTRNVLKLARQLGVARFIFASSLAGCRFSKGDVIVDEDSPCDADYAYARSKRRGEELIREHAEYIPAAIVRMAAIYSDWCEYPPLYVFLRTWLSTSWNARILGGKGESAVTYLHVADLVALYHRIIEKSDELPRVLVCNASPEQWATHRELFQVATRDFYGREVQPICLPRLLAAIGIHLRWRLGRLRGAVPFEAPWMAAYIDKQLRVSASRTYEALDWRPTPRLAVQRRLLLMIGHLKSQGEVWEQRNEAALHRVAERPHLLVAEVLAKLREDLVEEIVETATDPANANRFCNFHLMPPDVAVWFVRVLYEVLLASVRARDRQILRDFAQIVAIRRQREGIAASRMQDFLTTVSGLICERLRREPALAGREQSIHDHVDLSFQLAADGVEDAYDAAAHHLLPSPARYRGLELPTTMGDLEHLLRQLEELAGESPLRTPPPGA